MIGLNFDKTVYLALQKRSTHLVSVSYDCVFTVVGRVCGIAPMFQQFLLCGSRGLGGAVTVLEKAIGILFAEK